MRLAGRGAVRGRAVVGVTGLPWGYFLGAGDRGSAAGVGTERDGILSVSCTRTGSSLLPLHEAGPSKCVSPCNLGLVLGYPERGGIFRCETRNQGRMSARYRYLDAEGAVRLSNRAIGSAGMRMRIFHLSM